MTSLIRMHFIILYSYELNKQEFKCKKKSTQIKSLKKKIVKQKANICRGPNGEADKQLRLWVKENKQDLGYLRKLKNKRRFFRFTFSFRHNTIQQCSSTS